MKQIYVWDIAVRLFHWSLVGVFVLNAFVLDDESKAHEAIGYIMVGFLLLRIIWGFIGTPYARFSSFPPDMQASVSQLKEMSGPVKRQHVGHTPLGALMIYNILLTLLGIGLSGYLMTTDMFWGMEWPEDMHEILVVWAEISVVLHIGAVIFESLRTKVNLPWAIITGVKSFK